MSLRIINKVYQDRPITWEGQFYTIKEITLINDELELINAVMVGMADEIEYGLTCSYSDFKEAVK
jgi:hypothetical protein